jgi:cytochrome c
MKMLLSTNALSGVLTAALLLTISVPAQAVDAEAAQALARQNKCFKCHAIDKKKEAIPWKEAAAKLKTKPDAQAIVIKHITSGAKVKLDDGTQEEHPIVKGKPDEIKNLADWILSL